VELGSIGKWVGGTTPSKTDASYWDGDVPWVSAKDMKVSTIADSRDHISQIALEHGRSRLVPSHSVLVVTRSGILEHALPVAVNAIPVAINQDIKALIPSSRVIAEFVMHYLNAMAQRILHECSKSGTTVASIEFTRFLRFKIPIPSLDEQRRVVEIIAEQFSRLDSAEANLSRALARARRLEEASYAAILESNSPRVTIAEIAATSSGGTPFRGEAANYGGEIPWVKSGELGDSLVRTPSEHITQRGLESSSAKKLPRGTLLLAMYGATVGKLGILDIEGAATNQAVCAIVPKDGALTPYLWYCLRGMRTALIRSAQGGAQPNISQGIIRGLKIPMPSIEERERLVRECASIVDAVARAKGAIVTARARTTALRRSLLRKLVLGEDPLDGPQAKEIEVTT